MAIGIWTPVVLSGVQVVFSDRLYTFANKLKAQALAAGTHMRFINLGCHPVYIHTTVPANDAAGLTGNPVCGESNVVMPRVATVYVYSPYDNTTLLIDVGTLT